MLRNILLAFALASFVFGQDAATPLVAPCSFTDPNGVNYELSTLIKTNGAPYKYEDKDGQILLNVCGNLDSLTPNPCGTGASVCFVDNSGMNFVKGGSISKMEWANIVGSPQDGVELTYGAGDTCQETGTPRKTALMFNCKRSAQVPDIVQVDRSMPCYTVVTIDTAAACPIWNEDWNDDGEDDGGEWSDSESASFNISLFGIMIISFAATLICLCVCTCIVKRRQCHKKCSQQEMTVVKQQQQLPLLASSAPHDTAPLSYFPNPYMPQAQAPQFYYYYPTVPQAVSVPVTSDDQISSDEQLAKALQAQFNAEV